MVLVLCAVSFFALSFSSIRCTFFSFRCPQDVALLTADKYDKNEEEMKSFFSPVHLALSEPPLGMTQGNLNQSRLTLPRTGSDFVKKYNTYKEALEDRADKNGVIFLISTDYGYINMALNLYFTSLQRFSIQNYLYVCSDAKAGIVLKSHGIAYFMSAQDKDGGMISAYGTRAFRRKTHIKTRIILDALKLGYTVFIVDVDIVFLQSPLPYLNCKECDIQIQSDGSEANTGFYLVRPTEAAIKLHQSALDRAKGSPGLSNQKAIDRTMEKMSRAGQIKMKMLSVDLFPHGLAYFETGKRMFAGDNPCKKCVIVHNNWIVSGAAKEYRFKEQLMWMVDNEGYYSNPTAKYISFNNPVNFGKTSVTYEEESLKAALAIGYLLKRIVILPAFHSARYMNAAKKSSFNAHFRVLAFDKAFAGAYREHMFLKHPLVPSEVLESQTDLIIIKSSAIAGKFDAAMLQGIKYDFLPKDPQTGASSSEILNWLRPLESFKVLRFHSLYKAFSHFDVSHKNATFDNVLKAGLVRGNYRQY